MLVERIDVGGAHRCWWFLTPATEALEERK
jgi:hypothetical protein